MDRSRKRNKTDGSPQVGHFLGGSVMLKGAAILINLKTGVTLKVLPLMASLSIDIVLDEGYKENVNGEKDCMFWLSSELRSHSILSMKHVEIQS